MTASRHAYNSRDTTCPKFCEKPSPRKEGAGKAGCALHPQPQPRFAIGLGCEIRHASRLIYASGMDLEKAEGTPIGVNCRLCERENCSQRAEPPITRTLILDENTRRVSSFAFSNAREL
jgi:predicted transcriptional regulator